MALSILCNQCKPVINNALFYVGKYQQSGKYIMTSSNSLAKVIETLERNPYYSKYTEKIAALQKESPDKLVSRWENYQRDTKKVPAQPSETRQMSSLSKPKAEIGSSSCVGISKYRVLNDIMKVEMIKDKTKEEIEKIWLEYFKNQDGIAAIISKETYEIIQRKSSTYPVFIFPLPRSQGYEFFMCQFSGNEAHFTSLINYQAFKENAPECLTIVHYPEIIDEKKIVLMNGEFDKNVLDSNEVLCLANQMQLYYGMDDKKRDKHLERFTNSPEDFKHMDLIAELECEPRFEPQSDVPVDFMRAITSSKLKPPPWFVTRSRWDAKEPTSTAPALSHPIRYVIVRNISNNYQFKDIVQCLKVKQRSDMQMYADIYDNFYIDRVGRVYEGRGWDMQNSDHYDDGFNFEWGWEKQKTISMSFVGYFYNYVVSPKEKTALNKVIEMGIELGKIASDYKVYHHKDAAPNLKSYVSSMKNFKALE